MLHHVSRPVDATRVVRGAMAAGLLVVGVLFVAQVGPYHAEAKQGVTVVRVFSSERI